PDPKLAVPIAGNDSEAVKTAAALVRDAGFDPVIVGKLAEAACFQRGAPGYGQAVTRSRAQTEALAHTLEDTANPTGVIRTEKSLINCRLDELPLGGCDPSC